MTFDGRFHVLSDFDEGKRSCRRKLERHNNRRRRKPADSSKGSAGDKEVQGDLLTEDTTCDAEAGKGFSLYIYIYMLFLPKNGNNLSHLYYSIPFYTEFKSLLCAEAKDF
jgi:hypothetical protein